MNVYSQHSNNQSDHELWLELRQGNKQALRSIFLRYYNSLFRYGLAISSKKTLTEDCLQELFFYLWENHKNLSDVKKIKGYLWIAFRRRLMVKLKLKGRDADLFIPYKSDMKKENSIEKDIIQQEQKKDNHQSLRRVFDCLTQKEREALFLKYYEGMSYPEIEQILDVSYQTARNYVYRAISRLRKALEKEGIEIVLSFAAIPLLHRIFV